MSVKVKISEIIEISMRLLTSTGMSKSDADIIINHLLDGELAEQPSHGFYRIPAIVSSVSQTAPTGHIAYEVEAEDSCLINGQSHQGLVVAQHAVELIISKLNSSDANIYVIGGFNYVGTTGSMGYFTRQIANEDLIGFMIANSAASIPAWGALEPIFGTNPIAFGIPSEDEPIVIDLATSKWAYGNIALAMKKGEKIPRGIVLNKYGKPSTDPNDSHHIMLPFGEHKGYALALAVELLAGPLVRAKAGTTVPGSDGFTMIAIKPTMFTQLEAFKAQVSRLIEEIKSSSPISQGDEIFFPGERSNRVRNRNKDATHIEMVDQIYDDIMKLLNKQEDEIKGEYW